MAKDRVIALMSDWGTDDGSVGSVKGVILGIDPGANIVDMSHNVASYGIEQGAFLLMAHYRTYPKGTIFMVVVDPGVGTKRKAILVENYSGYFFLGPDNGVLSWALQKEKEPIKRIIDVTNEEYFRKPVSNSFHGRDIFAPVAAHLSRGVPADHFGEDIHIFDIVWADYPLEITDTQIIGEILYTDKFGNLITSIRKSDFDFIPSGNIKNLELKVGKATIRKLSNAYEDGKGSGEPLAIFGGDFGDLLDIALYEGNVAEKLGVKVGDKVTIARGDRN